MAAACFFLTVCGSGPSTIACPASSGATCTCGSAGTAACPIMPGPEFLYAPSVNQVQAFSIDHSTGALTSVGTATGPTAVLYPMAAVNNQFLYAPDSLNAQLWGYSINQTTGALTSLGSPFSTGTFSVPAGLASPPGSNFLYAADVAGIDAFTVSSSGTPTAISGPPIAGGSFDLAADPSGQFLYASDFASAGSVYAFTIDSAGTLTAVPNSPFTDPGQGVQTVSRQTIVDTGSFVYVVVPGANQLAAFSIQSGTGALVPIANAPFATGNSPLDLAYGNGFLYVNNVLDGTISGYSVNSSTGALTPLMGSPFAIVGAALTVDSLGQYLYAFGAGGILGFSINSSSGALTAVNGSPFPASLAENMTVVQIPPP